MTTEFIAHGGENLVGKVRMAARTESCGQRRAENGSRDTFFDGCHNRPAALAGIRNTAFEKSDGSSIMAAVRSSSHDAMTLPRRHSSAISQIQIELVMFRMPQRCGLGVGSCSRLPALAAAECSGLPHRRPSFRIRCRYAPSSRNALHRLDRSADSLARPCRPFFAPGVRGIDPTPGARDLKTGSRDRRCSASPPIIRQ